MDSWEQNTIKPALDRFQKLLLISQACFCIYKLFGKEIWDSRNVEISILMHSADREIFSCLISRHICLFSMSLTIQLFKPDFFEYAKETEQANCDTRFQVSECTALLVVSKEQVKEHRETLTSFLSSNAKAPGVWFCKWSSQHASPLADCSLSISIMQSNRLRSENQ